jgi:hypothetical protein
MSTRWNHDGGIHEIPLPDLPGRLWLCGKHVVGPDPGGLLDRTGADTIVCLTERHELFDRYPHYVHWLAADRERCGSPYTTCTRPTSDGRGPSTTGCSAACVPATG